MSYLIGLPKVARSNLSPKYAMGGRGPTFAGDTGDVRDATRRHSSGTRSSTGCVWTPGPCFPWLSFTGSSSATVNAGFNPFSILGTTGTVSWWCQHADAYNASSTIQPFFSINTGAGTSLSAQKFSDGNFYCGWSFGSDQRVTLTVTAANYPANTPTHYALAWTAGGSTTFYCNGIAIGNRSLTFTGDPGQNLIIGQVGTAYFTGQIGAMRIWDRQLSPQDIVADYADPNRIFAEPPTPRRFFGAVSNPPSTTLSPTTEPVNATSVYFTLTGNATSWVSGTNPTLSGGTGASILSHTTNYGSSPQTITGIANVGSASGTLTFGNSTDSSTATMTITGSSGTNSPGLGFSGGFNQ